MIICDSCGTPIPKKSVQNLPTKEDPYGESIDWCEDCFRAYGQIREEVKERLTGIFDRAVERRWRRHKARRLELSEQEVELFG